MKKAELIKALEAVKPGLANREMRMIEQSTSFAFMEDRVVTYNDEISISYPLKGIPIQGAIKAEELYAFLSKVKTEEIEIETDDTEIRLKAGRAKAGFTLQSEIKLPLEELDEKTKWKTVPEGLMDAIKFAAFSCSSDMSRPILTCINVDKSGLIESSDNLRITRYEIEKLPVESFLLPATSARDLVKYNPTEMCSGKGWIHFQTKNGTVFSCRILDVEFPDISKILEVEGVEVSFPKTIEEILERTSVFSKKENANSGDIIVSLEKNKITLRSEGISGWSEEDANIRYSAEPVSFMVHPQLLKEIVSKVRKCILGSDRLRFEGEGWIHVVALQVKED